MRAIFQGSELIAKDIHSFYFKTGDKVHQIAGQYTEIVLRHDNADDRGEKRWFTLSNSPTEDHLSITTKIIEKSSSFKKALKNLKPDTELDMASPMGDLILPKDPSIPLTFVAGGIGCTPYHSIIKYLTDTGEKRNIRLIYGVSDVESLAFRELFESYLGKDFVIIPSSAPEDWLGEKGSLTAEKIMELKLDDSYVYVSGPEPMVESFEKDLQKLGLPKNQFHGDYFPNYKNY